MAAYVHVFACLKCNSNIIILVLMFVVIMIAAFFSMLFCIEQDQHCFA